MMFQKKHQVVPSITSLTVRKLHKSTQSFGGIPVTLGRNCPDSIQDHKDFRAYDWTGKTSRKFSSLVMKTQISNAEMLIPVTL